MSDPWFEVDDHDDDHDFPELALIGQWWTYDAPSLRVADKQGRYTSVWTTGSGTEPSVLLLSDAAHDRWDDVVPGLGSAATLHAMEADDTAGSDAVVVAAQAVGAQVAVAEGAAVTWLLAALPSLPGLRAVLLQADRQCAEGGSGTLVSLEPDLEPERLAAALAPFLSPPTPQEQHR